MFSWTAIITEYINWVYKSYLILIFYLKRGSTASARTFAELRILNVCHQFSMDFATKTKKSLGL
jgi:hypothetical protein